MFPVISPPVWESENPAAGNPKTEPEHPVLAEKIESVSVRLPPEEATAPPVSAWLEVNVQSVQEAPVESVANPPPYPDAADTRLSEKVQKEPVREDVPSANTPPPEVTASLVSIDTPVAVRSASAERYTPPPPPVVAVLEAILLFPYSVAVEPVPRASPPPETASDWVITRSTRAMVVASRYMAPPSPPAEEVVMESPMALSPAEAREMAIPPPLPVDDESETETLARVSAPPELVT